MKKNPSLNLLFISVYESRTMTCLREYINPNTNCRIDTMTFGIPISLDGKIIQEIIFTRANGEIIDKTLRFEFPYQKWIFSFLKFFIHLYGFFLFFEITKGKKYHIAIAETSTLNTFVWLFKKLGKCEMSVAHINDIYATEKKKIIHKLSMNGQIILRRLAYKNDLMWYLHERLREWDEEHGFHAKNSFTEIDSFDAEKVKKFREDKKQTNQLCYIGRMDPFSGLDIILMSIRTIQKKIPDIKLKIIGGYNKTDIAHYRNLAQRENVLDYVEFLGYIEDRNRVEQIIRESALGIAIYKPDKQNGVMYTVPGKVSDYLQMGTPVVISENGPPVTEAIEKFGAGILVQFDPLDAAEKIINVLLQQEKYNILRDGVVRLTKEWSHSQIQPRVFGNLIHFYETHF